MATAELGIHLPLIEFGAEGHGCQRVYIWPLGDEPRQIELVASATSRL